MNFFRDLAAKYDAWFATPHGQYVYQYERQMIFDLLQTLEGKYVADIGCGTGIFTNELCQRGARVVGVDISPEMLAIATEKNRIHAGRVEFRVGDAAQLPFADDQFDAVVSITAMEFFADPRKCVHEMLRIVRPGGHLVLATLNRSNIWSLQRRIKAWFRPTIFTHTKFYNISDLKKVLEPYRIAAWQGGIFIPPFAPEVLFKRPARLEQWGQKHIPQYGAFLAARVDKQ